jgi:hypothetical protein
MDYELWIMDYGLWIMKYGLWIMTHGLWIMNPALCFNMFVYLEFYDFSSCLIISVYTRITTSSSSMVRRRGGILAKWCGRMSRGSSQQRLWMASLWRGLGMEGTLKRYTCHTQTRNH